MELITEYISSVFSTLCVILTLLPNIFGIAEPTWAPENENVILNCAVVADTHTDGNVFRDRNDKLRKAYADISSCSEKTDVLLNIGDLTNSGTAKDYKNVRRLDRYTKTENTVVCLGNHDSWNGSDTLDYGTALKNFTGYLASKGIYTDKAYYSKVIDGYYFICLATERCDHDELLPLYSEEQLAWFDEELSAAKESGLPVFVLSHLAVNGKNGISSSNLPDRVDEIMQSHSDENAPILFFSGHHHRFSKAILDSKNNVYYINMPSTQYSDECGVEDAGCLGMTMEVTENSIILRARNFRTGTFVDGYRFEIDF